jgi:ABC-type polar amino acid transport system ATPase subunit
MQPMPPPASLRSRIGMVFQNFELFPHMTVAENIALAQLKVLSRDRAAAEAKAHELLERMGLAQQAAKYPSQLSGGQQQRVAIARASPWTRSPCCSTSRPRRLTRR